MGEAKIFESDGFVVTTEWFVYIESNKRSVVSFTGGIMRILNMLVLTIVILSLAMVATAQTTEGRIPTYAGEIHMGFIKTSTVPVPAAGSTKIDPTKVKFMVKEPCSRRYGFSGGGVEINVMGIVARDVELSDDATAQQLLQMGIAFGRERCPSGGEFYDEGVLTRNKDDDYDRLKQRAITLSLFIGDPMTFTSADIQKFFDARARMRGRWMAPAYNQLLDEVYGYWIDDKPELIINYTNYPKALKLSLAYDAQKAREQEAALERQRQAEKLRQDQIAARLSAFVKKNGVKRFVTIQQLTTNPFVYKGQVVALWGVFEQMTSEIQGTFSSNDKTFVVSGIPTARFTQRRSFVILAVRVLGNIEVGSTLVPHLSFVGSAFCQEQGCRDYIP